MNGWFKYDECEYATARATTQFEKSVFMIFRVVKETNAFENT